MSDESKRWATLSSRTVYENPWMRVTEDRVRSAGGVESTYGVVRHKAAGACALPIDAEGHTWLVGQHRHSIGRYSWEVPAGALGPDGDPLAGARRELSEETGLAAADWHPILHLLPVNSITDLEIFGYLAWNLTPGPPHPDAGEELALRRVPFAEALRMVLAGEITNAVGVAVILQAHVLALHGGAPPALARFLRAGH